MVSFNACGFVIDWHSIVLWDLALSIPQHRSPSSLLSSACLYLSRVLFGFPPLSIWGFTRHCRRILLAFRGETWLFVSLVGLGDLSLSLDCQSSRHRLQGIWVIGFKSAKQCRYWKRRAQGADRHHPIPGALREAAAAAPGSRSE